MSSLTLGAVEPLGVKPRDAERSKNFFALGLVSWMYTRPIDRDASSGSRRSSRNKPQVRDANIAAFKAGHAFGETAELFDHPFEVEPGAAAAGHLHEHQRQHRAGVGPRSPPASCRACRCSSARTRSPRRPTSSTSCRSTSASTCARCRPRTRSPASARPSAPPTAATSPCTTTSGPGVALKAESMGLAVSLELPLLIIDIQRGGPSTGLPTKTEAADLLHGACTAATASRRCRSWRPTARATASSPPSRRRASRSKYRTPVILLSDGYLANGTEPWRLPDVGRLPDISTTWATAPNHVTDGRRRGVLALPPRPRHARPRRGRCRARRA